jgi:hypothetical protein
MWPPDDAVIGNLAQNVAAAGPAAVAKIQAAWPLRDSETTRVENSSPREFASAAPESTLPSRHRVC